MHHEEGTKININIIVPKLCSKAPWGTRAWLENFKFQGKHSNTPLLLDPQKPLPHL